MLGLRRNGRGRRVLLAAGTALFLVLPVASDEAAAAVWYVNDTSTTGDSYTYAAGYDTQAGTVALPFKSIKKAVDSAASGDTIYVDAGRFGDTNYDTFAEYAETAAVNITKDSITIIGKDSNATVIDPPGSSSDAGVYGIYADSQTGLVIKNLGVTGANTGIHFINVDQSAVTGDSCSSNGSNGIFLTLGSDSNTIQSNQFISNNFGVKIDPNCHTNTVINNIMSSNAVFGIYIGTGQGNSVLDNTMASNNIAGLELITCSGSLVRGNILRSNGMTGLILAGSENVTVVQNTFDSNVQYQIDINSASSSDTVQKNNIYPSPTNPDSGVTNSSSVLSNKYTFTRNYWGTTDEASIKKKLFHADGGDSILFRPYRLAAVDTSSSADTTAPLPPIGVTCTAVSTYITVTWAIPTVNEETNGGSFGYSGARIYRLTNTADTTHWANSANLVRTTSSTETQWNDTTVSSGSAYYYRLASFDSATYVNHSALTDTKSATASGGASKWYVNDTYSSSADSYTYSYGSDTGGAGTAASPYRTIRKALLSAKSGDTIYVDAGLFGDTGYDTFAGYTETAAIKIDTDNITIIGKDSGSTVLDPPGASSLAGVYGVYADTQWGIVIKNIGVMGAYDGFHFENVDSSVLSGDSVAGAGNFGIYLLGGSDTNTLSGNHVLSSTNFGIYLYNGPKNNLIYNNTSNSNVQIGIYLNTSAESNVINANTVNSNTIYGIYLVTDANYNVIVDNAARSNTRAGIFLNTRSNSNTVSGNSVDTNNSANTATDDYAGIIIGASHLNRVTGNSVRANGHQGIYIYNGSETNLVRNNSVSNNLQYGIGVSNSRWNVIEQNQLDSNASYQFLLNTSANADTFSKNNVRPSPSNPDSGALNNVSGQKYVFTRNWWDTTDEITIRKRVASVEGGDSMSFNPYRLGPVDTTAGADTTAPLPPIGVTLAADSIGQIKVTWTIPTVSEETNSSLNVYYGGAKIYRLTNTADTNNWANPANLVWTASSSATSWTDTTTLAGSVYYYRLTSIDTATIVNQSFFTDTVWARATRSVWYVNDTATSADSFTYAAGSDTGSADGSPSKPYRSVAKVMQFAKSWDTIYIDAGLYADTYVYVSSTETAAFRIDTDNISIVGKDSNATVINPPGLNTVSGLYGIYADTQTGLVVRNVGFTGAYNGIKFVNVDSSIITSDSAGSNGQIGIYLLNGSDSNTISYSDASYNSSNDRDLVAGIAIHGSTNNAVNNNITNSNSCTNTNTAIGTFDVAGVHLLSSSKNTIGNNTSNFNQIGVDGGGTSGAKAAGIYLDSSSFNTVSNNQCDSGYGIFVSGSVGVVLYLASGIYLNSSYGNTVTTNSVAENYRFSGTRITYVGIDMNSSSGNFVNGNRVESNAIGIRLTGSSNNVVSANIVDSNFTGGLVLVASCTTNLIALNRITNSRDSMGILIYSSDSNIVTQNEVTGNDTGLFFNGTSSGNVVTKNNVTSNKVFNVYSKSAISGASQSLIRNWWGTTDADSGTAKVFDTVSSVSPHRLGPVDTTSGADTTAPLPPIGVGLTPDTTGRIVVSWTIPTVNEETNGGTVGYNGAKIYRLTNTADTTNWGNSANLVWTASSSATSWTDTTTLAGNTYYYRLTSIDTSTVVNQSFFSDTKSAKASRTVWYVNDTATSADSFTYAAGSDTGSADGSPSKPYRSVAKVMQTVKAWDTIYIDAGLYADTYVSVSSTETAAFKIDTDYITIIGKDSNATVINPPGESNVSGVYGIYADTQIGLIIKNLGVTGAYDGIIFINVDSSILSYDSSGSNGEYGIFLGNGSESNTLSFNVTNWNLHYSGSYETAAGIYMRNSSSNLLIYNTANNNKSPAAYSHYAGILLDSCSNNILSYNTTNNNSDREWGRGGSGGIYLAVNSSNNTLSNNLSYGNDLGINITGTKNILLQNTVDSNVTGIHLGRLSPIVNSSNNILRGNRIVNNRDSGVSIESSDSNILEQNDISGNDTGIFISFNNNTIMSNPSWNNLISKNNIYNNKSFNFLSNSAFIATSSQTLSRNWWGTTAADSLMAKVSDTASVFSPFRLGPVDTSSGADTTAPGLPTSVTLDTSVPTVIKLTWVIPTVSEETNGGSVSYAGAKIYRLKNKADTTQWADSATLVYTATSTESSWTDTNVSFGDTYYYRLTSFDTANPANQSFFTDTKWATPTTRSSVKVFEDTGFIDEVDTYLTRDLMYIEVRDSDENRSSSAVETVTVTVTVGNGTTEGDSAGLILDTETIVLTESGAWSAVFRSDSGTIILTDTKVPVAGDLVISWGRNDTLHVKYTDANDANDSASDTALAIEIGTSSRVQLYDDTAFTDDVDTYKTRDVLYVAVFDTDENRNPQRKDTVFVTIYIGNNTTSLVTDTENITLTESTETSGIFLLSAGINLTDTAATTSNNGFLTWATNDTLHVVYIDTPLPIGVASDSASDTALLVDTDVQSYSGPVWYVNDTSTTGDVYTSAIGYDTSVGVGSAVAPYRSVAKALQSAKSGDTIYVDAGLYTDTYVVVTSGSETAAFKIDTDYITIIGKDSNASVINPPGDSSVSGLNGIYAAGRKGLSISNLGITGAYNGLFFDNVDLSTISSDSISSCGSHGIVLYNGSDTNTVINNTTSSNAYHGIILQLSSNNNRVSNNTASSNSSVGIRLQLGSDNNTVSNNTASRNSLYGINLWSSSNSMVFQNTLDSNAAYQIYLDGTSSSDTVVKNNIRTSPTNPDSGVFNNTGNSFDFSRNWWDTTDEFVINKKIFDTGTNAHIQFRPYRLGPVDTTAGADTTAPGMVASVSLDTSAGNVIKLTWTIPTINEETNGGTFAYNGAKIYRLRNTVDTNHWGNPANLVWIAGAADTIWNDTGVIGGETYYYRITSLDSATYVNQSFFTDTKFARADTAYAGPKWYVNDTYSSSADSFSYASGSDTGGDGSTSKPFRSAAKAMQKVKSGDTVYVDAGLYAETYVLVSSTETAAFKFDTDYITVIGKDSNATVIDPPGDSMNRRRYGIYATGRVGLTIKNLGVTGAGYGINWLSVDTSFITGDSVSSCGFYGIAVGAASDSNTISGNLTYWNDSYGIYLESNRNNAVTNNLSSWNGIQGIFMNLSYSNTICSNTLKANFSSGIYLESCTGNAICGNTADSNNTYGIALTNASSYNEVYSNLVTSNGEYGVKLDSSYINLLRNNLVKSNFRVGVQILNSDTNTITLNDIAANDTGVRLQGFSRNNLISKNNFLSRTSANVWNASALTDTITFNWWGMTAEDSITALIADTASNAFRPYRLGLIDTTPGADSTAPAPPVGVALDTNTSAGKIVVTWTIPTVNEETNGGTISWAGAKIYRLKNTADTNNWGNGNNLVFTTSSTAISWIDTGVTAGDTYYYRLTSIDGSAVPNQSFFTDTKWAIPQAETQGRKWYVNDTYSSATDSFTYAAGSDTGGSGTTSSPYRSVAMALQGAKSGDTIYVDAGLYAETYVNVSSTETAAFKIDTDYITIIGKDSASTVIDPPGANDITTMYGIYADTQKGLLIKNLGVTGAYDGIHFYNVDQSTITGDSACSNGNYGIYLRVTSDTNTVSNNTASSNTYGICLSSSSNNNMVSNNTANSNSNWGIYLSLSSINNTVSNNMASSNSNDGIFLSSSSNNTLSNNTASSNLSVGIRLQSSSNNTVSNNMASSNLYYGISLSSSSNNNTVSNNTASSNSYYGINLFSSSNNTFVQNDVLNNTQYQIYIDVTSSSDTVFKNNIKTSATNPDSGMYNGSTEAGNKFTFTRNWWNSTDAVAIQKTIFQPSNGDSIIWQPFRLGQVDTTSAADTTAPGLPASVSATASGAYIAVSWTIPTVNEETNGGSVGYAGAKIYRLTNTVDTTNWGNPANLVWTASSSATSWTDTGVVGGSTYYYRLTSFDSPSATSSFFNQSFFTDTKSATATGTAPAKWYVNDTYSSSADSFSYAAGSDTGGSGTTSAPYRSVAKALQGAKSGDTIYVDAGYFYETYVIISAGSETAAFKIDTDYIVIIGKDSGASIIDPPGTSASGLYGIYADTQTGILIKNIAVSGAYDGVYFRNVDSSTLISDSFSHNAGSGITLVNGSDSNVINSCMIHANSVMGVSVTAGSSNTIVNNDVRSNTSLGIILSASAGNTVTYNTVRSSLQGLEISECTNTIIGWNTIDQNTVDGLVVYSSHQNRMTGNFIKNNATGINISLSSYNVFVQNTAESNAGYQITLGALSVEDTFTKNNFRASAGNPDSYVLNTTNNSHDFTRNYWDTTDEVTIDKRTADTASTKKLTFRPYRLDEVDTAAGADTTAPHPPVSFSIATSSGSIVLSWSIPAINEETNGGNVAYAGAGIYRTTSADTSHWANPAIRVFIASSSATSWTDTTASSGTTYYYRMISFDTSSFVNHSAFTDTKSGAATGGKTVDTVSIVGGNHQITTISSRLGTPLKVRLTDSTGAAIAYSRVTFAIASTPSTTGGYFRDSTPLTSTDSAWTDSDGYVQDTFTLGTTRGVYLITATSDSNTAKKALFYAYADGVDITASKWKMVATNKKAATTFGTITAGMTSPTGYGWKEDAGVSAGLADYSQLSSGSTIDTGRAYWVYTTSSGGYAYVAGSTGFDTVRLVLTPGWHMISSGQYFYIDWDSGVQFDTNGTKYYPADADSRGVIKNVVYWYTGSVYYWGPDRNTASLALTRVQMKPMVGFWIYTPVSCTMWVYPNPASPAETSTLILQQAPEYTLAAKYQDGGSEVDWVVRLGAEAGEAGDIQNYFGVRASAEEAARAGVFDPPAAAGNFVALGLVGEDGLRRAASYVEPVTTVRTWQVDIATDMDTALRLSWENVQSIPAKYGAYLIGGPSGPVDLRKSSALVFQSKIPLTLAVGLPEYLAAFLAGNLDKTQTFAYPNPGPDGTTGNVTFKYNLQNAADVTVRIFDVGGRLVRELRQGGNPGSNLLPWDTTNRHGQRLGSGVYIYIIQSGGQKMVDKVAIVR